MEPRDMFIKKPNHQQSLPADERGFILIITMLVLVVLTILCIGALDNSTFEVRIAANDRQARVAFNLADGGAYAAGKLIGEAIENTADPAYADLSYVDIFDPSDRDYSPFINVGDTGAADIDIIANDQVNVAGELRDLFNSRIKGFTDPRTDNKFDFMIRDPNGQGDVYGRIAARTTEVMAGGGAEFASGSAGVGTGSAGSTAVTVDMDVDSFSARNTRSRLAVRYRKVLGAAGGL